MVWKVCSRLALCAINSGISWACKLLSSAPSFTVRALRPRSEEHTSELQSLPTRHSSDLDGLEGLQQVGALRHQFGDILGLQALEFGAIFHRQSIAPQIGRAHV